MASGALAASEAVSCDVPRRVWVHASCVAHETKKWRVQGCVDKKKRTRSMIKGEKGVIMNKLSIIICLEIKEVCVCVCTLLSRILIHL